MESCSKSKSKECKEKNIQVFVRVRPLNSAEKAAKSCSIVDCSSSREIIVKERINDKTFGFDRVFDQGSKQVDVYRHVVNPLIDEVLAGYNCTVFAYGQTGTGKTFTMEGEKSKDPSISWQDDPLSGIVPRAMNHLFDELRTLGDAEFTVRVSFLEIYNEELIDLLSASDDMNKLRLFEDSARKGSVIIQNIEEKAVHNKDEVYKILEKGSQKRQTAATQMNAHSSRSHTIFTITIHIKDNSLDGEELLRTGKLNLVDLAGSENIGRSGAQDKRAREAGNINQSLLTLGRCITALVEKTPHIPYRESKLTRLLQDSLGGRTKTSIIATISPAQLNVDETLSTLDYAHRAKNITNRPEINQKMSKKALIKEYTEEIEKLRRDLQASREKNGVFLAAENYEGMVNELEYLRSELSNKINNIKAMVEQKENLEKVLDDLKLSSEKEIEDKSRELESAREKIVDVEYKKKEQEYLVRKHRETEDQLTEQAQQVREAVEEASYDLTKLQETLERVRKLEKCNASNVHQLSDRIKQSAAFFASFTEDHMERVKKSVQDVKLATESDVEQQEQFADNVQGQISGLDGLVDNIISCTGQKLPQFQTSHEDLIRTLLAQYKTKMTLYDEYCAQHVAKFNALCGDLLTNDLGQIGANQSELQAKLSAVKDKLVSMQSDHAMIEASLNENRVATAQQIENMEHFLSDIEAEEKQLDQFNEEENEMIDEFAAMVKSSLEKLQSHRTRYIQEQKVQVRNKREQGSTLLDELKSGMTVRNEKLLETLQRDTAEKTESIVQLVTVVEEESDTKTTAAVTAITERVDTLKVDVAEAFKDSKDIQQRACAKSEETCDLLRKSVQTHLEDINKLTLEGIGFGVKGRTTMLRDSATNHLTACKKSSDSCRAQLDTTQEQLESLGKTIRTQHQCVDLVQGFVNTQYLSDTPSGETPPRKELKYPSRFASTSPHERLLARFRLSKPRDQFNLEEALVEETPTEESDSSVPRPRRSSSLNDLKTLGPSDTNRAESISPASSDILVKGSKTKKNQKENILRKPQNAGKIPVISKTRSADSVARGVDRRGVLAEKN